MRKTSPPIQSYSVLLGFLWQECMYFFRSPIAKTTAVFLEPEAEGSCFLVAHILTQHPSMSLFGEVHSLSLPASAATVPASAPVMKSVAAVWIMSRQFREPFREQNFGFDCDFSYDSLFLLENYCVGWSKKVQAVILSWRPKVEEEVAISPSCLPLKDLSPESFLELLVSWLYTYTLVFEYIYWCSQHWLKVSGSTIL